MQRAFERCCVFSYLRTFLEGVMRGEERGIDALMTSQMGEVKWAEYVTQSKQNI